LDTKGREEGKGREGALIKSLVFWQNGKKVLTFRFVGQKID
jgi:hypothetical protein